MLLNKMKFLLVLGLGLFVLTGCAGKNLMATNVKVVPAVISPPEGKAMLVFYRRNVLYGQPVEVFLNKAHVASLSKDEKTYIFVSPGQVQLAFSHFGVFPMSFIEGKVEENSVYYFGLKVFKQGMWDGGLTAVRVFNQGLQHDNPETGGNVAGWLKKDRLVSFNKVEADKWYAENKDDVDEAFIEGYEEYKNIPMDRRFEPVKSVGKPFVPLDSKNL